MIKADLKGLAFSLKGDRVKNTKDGKTYFFVDESGDTTFYNKRGYPIVGTAGCSPLLLIGFIEVRDPHELRKSIIHLHQGIISEPYFQKKASFKKTKVALHAKDDCPEVRELVYEALRNLEFTSEFVVVPKNEQQFRIQFGANENRFYDHLVTLLFRNVLHRFTDNQIIFAQRGSRLRQAPLTKAINGARQIFEKQHAKTVNTSFHIQPQSPSGEPCLSAIDYLNWAIYQVFVRGDMRYYRKIESKISIIKRYNEDLVSGSRVFCKRKPLDIDKATPLALGSIE